MKLNLSLLVLLCLSTTTAFAYHDRYEKGEVIRQGMGTEGDTPVDAAKNFAEVCGSNPFIEAGLAELTGIDDVEFHPMPNNKVLAYGTCLVTMLKTIVRSEGRFQESGEPGRD